jgi:hypothetical protein
MNKVSVQVVIMSHNVKLSDMPKVNVKIKYKVQFNTKYVLCHRHLYTNCPVTKSHIHKMVALMCSNVYIRPNSVTYIAMYTSLNWV